MGKIHQGLKTWEKVFGMSKIHKALTEYKRNSCKGARENSNPNRIKDKDYEQRI